MVGIDNYPPGVTGPCWVWKNKLNEDGYGRLYHQRQHKKAHRVSYELHVGPIKKGLVLDHKCRNRACVRPEHLEPVTLKVNTLRGVSFAAELASRTHCNRGHKFTKANTTKRKDGGRRCKTCRREGS